MLKATLKLQHKPEQLSDNCLDFSSSDPSSPTKNQAKNSLFGLERPPAGRRGQNHSMTIISDRDYSIGEGLKAYKPSHNLLSTIYNADTPKP